MSKFEEKLIKNLSEYGIQSLEEFRNDWKYTGGNKGSHLKYWILVMEDMEVPEEENACICGCKIVENCYITKDTDGITELMVLGNCCIKRFITKSGRTCEDCNSPHKNRKINKCNKCKAGICLKCFKRFESTNEKRSYCYDCKPSFWDS